MTKINFAGVVLHHFGIAGMRTRKYSTEEIIEEIQGSEKKPSAEGISNIHNNMRYYRTSTKFPLFTITFPK